jgi:hypothetical protein
MRPPKSLAALRANPEPNFVPELRSRRKGIDEVVLFPASAVGASKELIECSARAAVAILVRLGALLALCLVP